MSAIFCYIARKMVFFLTNFLLFNNYAQIIILLFNRYLFAVVALKRSKLEMYAEILSVLAQEKSLGITHLMYKVNINCTILKEYVDFLIHQGLLEEHLGVKPKAVYCVTKRGVTVLQQFNDLKQVLPIIEESQNQA